MFCNKISAVIKQFYPEMLIFPHHDPMKAELFPEKSEYCHDYNRTEKKLIFSSGYKELDIGTAEFE